MGRRLRAVVSAAARLKPSPSERMRKLRRPFPAVSSPYFTFVPAGTLASTLSSDGSPSMDAARTMPFDSTPISFAGWRLATMTILRPTSSSGVYFAATTVCAVAPAGDANRTTWPISAVISGTERKFSSSR